MRSILWEVWQSVTATHITRSPLYRHGGNHALRINNTMSCLFIFAGFLFIVPLILLISTVIGAVAAAASAAATSRERESNRFDLLATTPDGVMGASWLLGLGAVHQHRTYQRLQSVNTWVFRMIFILLGYLALEAMLSVNSPLLLWQILVIPIGIVLAMAGFYVDHVQALTLGVLIGLMTPTYANDRIGAEVGAVLFYLLLRIVTLLLAFILMFGVLAPLFGLLPSHVIAAILLRVLQFVVFTLTNEVVARGVWVVLLKRMENDTATLRKLHLPVPAV